MSATVSDFIIERLGEWGIRRVFGYPGDGISLATAGIAVLGFWSLLRKG